MSAVRYTCRTKAVGQYFVASHFCQCMSFVVELNTMIRLSDLESTATASRNTTKRHCEFDVGE